MSATPGQPDFDPELASFLDHVLDNDSLDQQRRQTFISLLSSLNPDSNPFNPSGLKSSATSDLLLPTIEQDSIGSASPSSLPAFPPLAPLIEQVLEKAPSDLDELEVDELDSDQDGRPDGDETVQLDEPPLKRKRGRPKGSKNKPRLPGESKADQPKRPRGRPRKIRSPEEQAALEAKDALRQAGLLKRGRPKKVYPPGEGPPPRKRIRTKKLAKVGEPSTSGAMGALVQAASSVFVDGHAGPSGGRAPTSAFEDVGLSFDDFDPSGGDHGAELVSPGRSTARPADLFLSHTHDDLLLPDPTSSPGLLQDPYSFDMAAFLREIQQYHQHHPARDDDGVGFHGEADASSGWT